MPETRVTVYDGKYTVIHTDGKDLRALRHGEPWGRDLVGDGLVLALVDRIAELEELLDEDSREDTETFKITPPGTPKERIIGAAEAVQKAIPLPDDGRPIALSYAEVRKIRGYAENILIYANKLPDDPVEPWDDNLIQFARLLEEIRGNCEFSDEDFTVLSDSMDLPEAQIRDLFDRADIEFQRVKNTGRALRETPEADIRAYDMGQIASIV